MCNFLCQVDPPRIVYRGFICIRGSVVISHGFYGFRRIGGGGDRLPKLKVASTQFTFRSIYSTTSRPATWGCSWGCSGTEKPRKPPLGLRG